MSRFIVVLILLSLSVACSTGPQVNPAALGHVKKIGVLGFEITQEMPEDFTLSLGSTSEKPQGFGGSAMSTEAEHATKAYDVVKQKLSKNNKWKTVTRSSVVKNPTYKKLYKEQMSGWRSIPMTPDGFEKFIAKGVMDYWAMEKMDAEKRAALMKALGLDAAVLIEARSELKDAGFTLKKLVGGGNYIPELKIHLKVYGKDGKEAIWNEYQMSGGMSKEKVSHFGGIANDKRLNALVVEAAKIAAAKLDYRKIPPK